MCPYWFVRGISFTPFGCIAIQILNTGRNEIAAISDEIGADEYGVR
jgi:hypothetical protein